MDNKSSRKRCSKKIWNKIVEHPMLENISTTSLFAKVRLLEELFFLTEMEL